jgi:alkaline phosphatase D
MPKLNRRSLIRGAAAAAGGLIGSAVGSFGSFGQSRFLTDPFTLGIASGDPAPDGFVIWTRLALNPFNGGGMSDAPIDVHFDVAEDEVFKRVVRSSKTEARSTAAHSVHVEVSGLAPAREYFYRFSAGGVQSPIGRAKTLPVVGAATRQVKFAAVGCQRWEHGFFTAFQHLAAERLDFVVHYGDYIYEYAQIKEPKPDQTIARLMPVDYPAARTLADYRNRYAVYKSDADLQAAHASAPFVVSFDDHEVANNWAGQFADGSVQPNPTPAFLSRRAAALQAWYEHMPVRQALRPNAASIAAYRRLVIGDLATLFVLDTRQYRTAQPCSDGWQNCPAALDPALGLLGATQERWLFDGLKMTKTLWNVLAQQVMMMQIQRGKASSNPETHMDKWDGAVAGRNRLFAAIEASKSPGMVTLTGDIHNNWAGNLKRNFDAETSPTLGVEFVATSITSGGDGSDSRKGIGSLMSDNPHVKFFNNQRGYVRHTVDASRWQADFRVVEKVTLAGQPVKTRKTLISELANPGIVDA